MFSRPPHFKKQKKPSSDFSDASFYLCMAAAGRISIERSRGKRLIKMSPKTACQQDRVMPAQGYLSAPAQLLCWEGGETRPFQAGVVSLAFLRLWATNALSLTPASEEISGTENMIKSNMCLRAFLDQSPNDQLISPQEVLR